MDTMMENIKKQIKELDAEQRRVKEFINQNNFDCTTAPFFIVKQYRDALKAHLRVLRDNVEN